MATFTSFTEVTSVASGATLAYTGINASVGDFLILACIADNAGAGGISSTSTSITDASGNTWNFRQQTNNPGTGAANTGGTLTIWTCSVTVAFVAATITLNFSPNTTAKGAFLRCIIPGAGETVTFVAVGAGSTGAGTAWDAPTASVALGQTIIGFVGNESAGNGNPDTDTTYGSWSASLTLTANGGSAATSQSLRSQYKSVTETGAQTYNMTNAASRDWVANYLIVGIVTASSGGDAASDDTIYLRGFPGPAGSLDLPTLTLFAIDAGVGAIDLQATRGLAILLRASLVDPDAVVAIQGPPYVAGFLDIPTGFQIDFTGAVETIYPAASLGRSSLPDDTPANLYVPGKLMPLNFGIKLFDGIEPAPRGTGGLGAIILPDPDGELDDLIDLAWDGATLDILRGPPLARYDSYEVVGRMTTAGLLYDQRKKEIRLRDLGWQLQQAELHGLRYGGTGGADGDASLAGTIKPYGVGTIANAEPVQINAALLLYAVSCTSISGVDDVRDGGVSLAFSADYADYAALVVSTVSAGQYATCLAKGYIRLGGVPVFIVTVDFRGDADTVGSHGAPTTIGTVARRIATGHGTFRLAESQLDAASFGAFEAERSAAVGFYWREAISKADALDEVLVGTLGWWAVRLNGKLAIGYMRAPTDAPGLTLEYPGDFGGEPSQLSAYQAPRRATYVTWQRNYTLQDASRLALSVSTTDRLIWAQAGRLASSVSGLTPSVWPTSATVSVSGAYRDEVDALAEASRQQALMNVRRERWSIPVPCDPFADLLGRVVQINGFPRYGWGDARKFIVVGMSFASSRSVVLDLWG